MQPSQYYENLIIEGIRRLPPEALAEIADFIYFIRCKTEQPERFVHDRENVLLAAELKQLGLSEAEHLESEFQDYAKRYRRV
jgi:hypothetical protein